MASGPTPTCGGVNWPCGKELDDTLIGLRRSTASCVAFQDVHRWLGFVRSSVQHGSTTTFMKPTTSFGLPLQKRPRCGTGCLQILPHVTGYSCLGAQLVDRHRMEAADYMPWHETKRAALDVDSAALLDTPMLVPMLEQGNARCEGGSVAGPRATLQGGAPGRGQMSQGVGGSFTWPPNGITGPTGSYPLQ
jgi:hypothetical protein